MATEEQIPQFPFLRQHGVEPAPENAELRHKCPIAKAQLFDGKKVWMVMKHKDICEALSSEKLSADRRNPGYPEIHPGGAKAKEARPTFVNLDNPDHGRQRAMLEDAFTPEAVHKMRPMMQATVDKVVDDFIKSGQTEKPVDLMENFANIVPTQIIFKILGVPESDIDSVSKDSEIRHSTSRNAAETSNQNLNEYVDKLVEERIEKPQEDLISKLVKEQYSKGTLDKTDITTLGFLILTAGNAALLNSIGLGVLTLLRHPEQLDEFKTNPSIAPQVINEILRYHTVSSLNSRRVVKQDIVIGNQPMKEGDGVICAVQSGDRDEDISPNPDKFDIHRKVDPESVLGFGYGPHRCLADTFSRQELEIAITSLFQRIPKLKLAVPESDLKWSPPEQNIGIQELPVLLEG
ncbi:MAG: hypothetical protein M1820_007187 [Bogoriella megaspora]|nr:MAG: hypothetical protein M1820_007187 [Bogoriella megaspora]